MSGTAGNGQQTGHLDHVSATHNERRRGQQPGQHDQVPATHNERRRGLRPVATAKYLRHTTSGGAGCGLDTTTKYLRGAAGNGLGTTMKYLVNKNAGAGNNWAEAHYTKAGHEFC